MEYEKSASGSVYLIKSDKGYWLPGGFGYTSNKAEALPELVALDGNRVRGGQVRHHPAQGGRLTPPTLL